MTAETWAANAAGLLGLLSVSKDIPEKWQEVCQNALNDAPPLTLLGALSAVMNLERKSN
jgi:hypothetical protein